jgi:hypothetical protein
MCQTSVYPSTLTKYYWIQKHRLQNNKMGNFNTALSPIGMSSRQKKNQQRNLRINWHDKPNGVN